MFILKKRLRNTLQLLLLAILLAGFSFMAACDKNYFGIFLFVDLDERLKEANNILKFVPDEKRSEFLNPVWGEDFSFIVLTDIHIKDGNAYGFEKLGGVIANDSDIKFVVVLGDITQYGCYKDIQTFIQIAETFGVPFYPVIGNHDIYYGDWSGWKSIIGSTRYRIDADKTTLFIIDSANMYFGNDQLNWLERELKTAVGRVFVFTHANLFVETLTRPGQMTDLRERARILSILQNRSDAMFMGHSHVQVQREAGGVQYISINEFKGTQTYCRIVVRKSGISYHFEKL